MAKSRFEYVREFERSDELLRNTWIVIRLDGRGFHKFTAFYDFAKPNDRRALDLMNEAARRVVEGMADVVLAYGQSDEYSFVLQPACALFDRRESKLVSTFASTFTAWYVFLWPQYFDRPLEPTHLPTFDSRAVLYPSLANLRDYMSWRQADCHINNLYNTTFWSLVQSGLTPHDAEQRLMGTVSADKNEILFSQFGINYNRLDEIYRKGTVIVRNLEHVDRAEPAEALSKRQAERALKKLRAARIDVLHVDIIDEAFWTGRCAWLQRL
ncbi:tRNAHis guanylyltransferase [Dipodascopsis tothii]|uniref:tRNAHis guanylyltransferase n=1 Tax=Dipodascopsis tothii TaxID=44089 RepID=UPI0034CD63CC